MNAQQQTAKNKGFTIIEVVLVLAIAGLIFLMVFIALPALQRNQRDTQRRDDASRFISQLQSYSTNNNGKIPDFDDISGTGGFADSYLKINDNEFNDPQTGEKYTFSETEPKTNQFQYAKGSKCDGENVVSASGSRIAAIRVQLEGSGIFCTDNQ
jgi:prepilin-type N-terminal cleavage/methylation domain-containing protein